VATLSHGQLMTLWEKNGGPAFLADIAAAIAQAESGGCQYAKAGPTDDRPVKQCTYRKTNLENSYGLWQINRRAHSQYSARTLYTLDGNAKAAVQISRNGTDFTPWSTYTSGAYKKFLLGLTAPPPGVPPIPGGPPSTTGRQADKGWNTLNHTVAHDLPSALKQASSVRAAALRRPR
jgi:lysozyme-like protein